MTNNILNGQQETEIDLLKLLKELWKHAWMIVTAAIVGGIAFFLFTLFFITPQYTSYALLYVNNNSVNIGQTKVNLTTGDINAASTLIETYSVILKSRNTLEKVIEEGGLPYTYEQLVQKVSGSAEKNTPVFKIAVTDPDPEMAAIIANRIVEVMQDKNTGIAGIVQGSSVSVVDYAVVTTSPTSPSYLKNTAIGMLLGFVITCGIIILRSLMDSTIREEEFLLDKYKDIPVLATIPDLTEDSHGGYYGYGRSYAKASDKARKNATAGATATAAHTKKEDNPFVNDGGKKEG